MDELIQQINLYKNDELTEDALKLLLVNHISRLNIEFLEERFGKVEDIGNMLGFYEVADTIYDVLKEDFKLTEDDLDKNIYVSVPVNMGDLLSSPKKFSIHNTVEKVVGKIKDLHDRKKLKTIRHKIEFTSISDMLQFTSELKLVRDRIASIEKHDKSLIIFTYLDIEDELISLCRGRYVCNFINM